MKLYSLSFSCGQLRKTGHEHNHQECLPSADICNVREGLGVGMSPTDPWSGAIFLACGGGCGAIFSCALSILHKVLFCAHPTHIHLATLIICPFNYTPHLGTLPMKCNKIVFPVFFRVGPLWRPDLRGFAHETSPSCSITIWSATSEEGGGRLHSSTKDVVELCVTRTCPSDIAWTLCTLRKTFRRPY